MNIRPEIKIMLDDYYYQIHVNDFSSFIRSDFRDDQLFDLSEERANKNKEISNAALIQINSVKDLADISFAERIILDIAADFFQYIIRNARNYWYKFDITHNTTPLPYVIKKLENYSFNNSNDQDYYLMLLNQFPMKLNLMIAKLQEQEKRGILLPAEQVQICISLIKSLIQKEDSKLKPWLRSNVKLDFSARYRLNIEEAITDLNLSLKYILDFLSYSYNQTKREVAPGLCNIRGGLDYYYDQILTYTSYPESANNLHEIGLRELRKTKDTMQAIIHALGFDMDLISFNQYLETERLYFDNSAQQLQARYDQILEKIKPRMNRYFIRHPKAGCRSQAMPKESESTTSWGYYSVPIGDEKEGVFYFSAAELSERSQIRTAAIVSHELLPGHHFQMNLIAEDMSLPAISREHFNTAFADGWAEYAADLANEMGVYSLFDLYGRYIWDLVLCSRLVVDTGLNALHWSIEEAREFMRKHTFLTEREIFTETMRYSVDMPGQALAYKYGSLKMREFRTKAESNLDSNFDIKQYHDHLLRYGSIPLNIAEQVVDNYINCQSQ